MKKRSNLTIYILVAMILGILVGYLVNQFGKGHNISYTPNKDFVGNDSIQIRIDGENQWQRILVVKDSGIYRKTVDSIDKSIVIAVSNREKIFTPAIMNSAKSQTFNGITIGPAKGGAIITNLKSFADYLKLLSTIFIRLVQMIIAPLVFCTLVVGIAKLGDLKSVGQGRR